MELVLAGFFLAGASVEQRTGRVEVTGRRRRGTCRLIPLEEDDAASLVACGQVVARMVELDCGDDIRWGLRSVSSCPVMTSRRHREERGHKPSVMSSTSPLSPKHLHMSQPGHLSQSQMPAGVERVHSKGPAILRKLPGRGVWFVVHHVCGVDVLRLGGEARDVGG